MEESNGEHSNLPSDVTTSSILNDSLDGKTVGFRSPSSSSSASSCSTHFEVDIGEDDVAFLEYEENGESPVVLNPESPRVISTSPQNLDLDTVYGCLKQSPPIQVMGQPTGYDLNQTPPSVFGRKHRTNSEWSLASNESLFSIHTGNNSFSMDGGFVIGKSGELNWIDDYCFTPDGNKSCLSPTLPTVMDTSAENERNSESREKEDVVETQNVSANISCVSGASCQSSNSFAFPILTGGSPSPSPSPTKVEAEKLQPAPSTPPAEAAQATTKAPNPIPKAGGNQWFHCFSCFPMCC